MNYFFIIAIFFSMSLSAAKPEITYLVETAVVKPTKMFLVERRYIGTIQAEKFSLLSPKTSGTVASIDIKAGQRVKKGQLLVSLKSNVEKRALELTEKNLSLAKKELERSRALFKSQDITKSQLEKSEREVIAAKSKLEEQKGLVENVEIRAPFDGIVGVPRVVLGQTVQSTTTIVSIMDGPFSVVINIPASRLSEIKAGQPVRIKSSSTKISAVEMSIDPVTRTGFAKAIFQSCESCIVGDSVYAHITVHEKPDAILINRNAIYYQKAIPHVVVLVKKTDGKIIANIKEIVVGEEQEGNIEVISGLKDGDEIVAVNPKRITEGALLKVYQ